MPEAWPENVNQRVLRTGLTVVPDDNAYRFKPDAGATIDTSRTITATETVQFSQWFTVTEYAVLKEWRLSVDVLPFTRLDPESNKPGTFVFLKDGFKLVELSGDRRRVAFILNKIA